MITIGKYIGIFCVSMLLAGVADAKRVQIAGKHSSDEIRKTCAANGGDYAENTYGYGCSKMNCGGEGTVCSVDCKKGKCTGTTPGRAASESGPSVRGGILRAEQ